MAARARRTGIPGLRLGSYTDRHGKQQKLPTWVLDVKRRGIKRQRHHLGRDREEALRLARAILAEVDRKTRSATARKHGDRDGVLLAEQARALGDHVSDFVNAVAARPGGRSKQHVGDLTRALTRYIAHAGATSLADLTSDSARTWLSDLAAHGHARDPDDERFKGGGWKIGPASQWTLQHARLRICQWSRWLVRQGRIPADPFAGLESFAPALDRKYVRGAYALEQVHELLRCKKLPLYRLACWHLASCTGLRRAELGRLVRASIDLERAVVAPPARSTKAKRPDALALTPECVEVLARYWALLDAGKRSRRGRSKTPIDLARALPEGVPAVKTLHADFARAGVDLKRAARGRVLDVHSLRVSLNVHLADAGFSVAERQAIMRHSSPVLTQSAYYELASERAHAAAEAIRPRKKRPARRRA